MGIIQAIYPNNSDTAARLGINIFKQVCVVASRAGCGLTDNIVASHRQLAS